MVRNEARRAESPSRIMKLCSPANRRTSLRRLVVAVIPVGLHPYCRTTPFRDESRHTIAYNVLVQCKGPWALVYPRAIVLVSLSANRMKCHLRPLQPLVSDG